MLEPESQNMLVYIIINACSADVSLSGLQNLELELLDTQQKEMTARWVSR